LVNGNPENPVKQDVPGILVGRGIKKVDEDKKKRTEF
jgi:hypothetical protein